MSRGLGYTQKKVLLLLAGGLTLGLTRSPKQYFRLVGGIGKEWDELTSRQLHDAVYGLYESELLTEIENSDGTITMALSEKGKKTVVAYDPEHIRIPWLDTWKGKWYVVLFDIPEKKRQGRDALRETLTDIGFYEYQKSVFVYPHDCRREIKFLIEHYEIARFVRLMIADSMDNEFALRKHFKL
ncbi:MAG: hypothetical protein HZA95_01200 [Candidatus Vogelbacteria bacterium]|nr:hypothetical protein [Candidatus Vogelbacteria bacterium]